MSIFIFLQSNRLTAIQVRVWIVLEKEPFHSGVQKQECYFIFYVNCSLKNTLRGEKKNVAQCVKKYNNLI